MNKLLSSKWLVALGLAPLAYFIWGSAAEHGEAIALGNALVLAALFAGVALGRAVGWLICKVLNRFSDEFEVRLKASLSSFGFFSLPWFVAVWTNKHLGTDISLMSLEMHIFWPCMVAIFAFFATPLHQDKK